MALENVDYVTELVQANPPGTGGDWPNDPDYVEE